MTISSSRGSYEIALCSFEQACSHLGDATVITDENVFNLYGSSFDPAQVIVLPPGEQSKSMEWFGFVLEQLAERKLTRRSRVVAFGGGVVGDLAGFVASAYMRGISYLQIPSTLMAQVDSSIGGKVGIDLKAGKNLAGAFYPPSQVFVCPELLRTLDTRQFNSGMAEVWKYSFISGKPDRGVLGRDPIGKDSSELAEIVQQCINVKAAIVQEDEFETGGARATLNFGHTVGHAIETATDYRGYFHGEAISIGMVAEAKLGENVGVTKPGTSEVVRECLAAQGLPTEMPDIDPILMFEAMRRDKKRKGNGLSFSLLIELGECKLVEDVCEPEVERALFQS